MVVWWLDKYSSSVLLCCFTPLYSSNKAEEVAISKDVGSSDSPNRSTPTICMQLHAQEGYFVTLWIIALSLAPSDTKAPAWVQFYSLKMPQSSFQILPFYRIKGLRVHGDRFHFKGCLQFPLFKRSEMSKVQSKPLLGKCHLGIIILGMGNFNLTLRP